MKLQEIAPGRGIATRKPEQGVKLAISSGLAVLVHDRKGVSGGLIHLPDGDSESATRLRRLVEAVSAQDPVAKLIGFASPDFVARVKRSLGELRVPTLAESIAEGAVVIHSHPARGEVRFKREATAQGSKAAAPSKVRVLIVDDAPVIRQLLKHILSQDPDFELAGEAGSSAEAEEILKKTQVDVMTLDIHMPVEDGVTFLGRYLKKRFVPTVLVTSVSLSEGEKVLEGLAFGAVDYVQKPKFDELEEVGGLLREKLKMAAKVRERKSAEPSTQRSKPLKFKARPVAPTPADLAAFRLVAIGASTGGVQALTEILCALPAEIPPIVIVQHIPPVFSKAFCERLDRFCPFRVKEAEDGDVVMPGQVLIAPGGFHMKVAQHARKLVVKVFDAERVNRHKPSVEVLFKSVAAECGPRALGVILTGMGDDGAEGLLTMKNAGAYTIAQDEASSVVWGMPGAAVKLGAAQKVLPLRDIGRELIGLAQIKKAS